MTKKKKKKGQAILKQINGLIEQKEYWEESYMFGDVYIRSRAEQHDSYHSHIIDTGLIDFEFAKRYALAKINNRINELQKEFDEL